MHQAMHGVNAVLLYDNNSTKYSTQELLQRLATSVDLDVLCLVRTPYVFGPAGGYSRRGIVRANKGCEVPWDSDFLDYFFPMHAHRRFLSQARFCLWGDVDEILLPEDGQDIGSKLQRTAEDALITRQVHTVHVVTSQSDGNRFASRADMPEIFKAHFQKAAPHSAHKYAYKPARISLRDQLGVHYICRNACQERDRQVFEPKDDSLVFRHFRNVNTGWKAPRPATAAFDKNIHLFDCRLVKTFARYAPKAGLTYPLEDILAHARAVGACPRPEDSAPAPSWPAYDCSACPYNQPG